MCSGSRCEHQLIQPCDLPAGDPLTLEHCPELRRLEFLTILPKEVESAVVSSITSINLTIAFLPDASHVLLHYLGHWEYLDNIACGQAVHVGVRTHLGTPVLVQVHNSRSRPIFQGLLANV